ncbi:hypothetical protein ACVW16_000181 [Bradyrhizobium sp. USDA 4474]
MPMISDAEIAEIRRKAADGSEPRERYDLSPLRTRAEVFAFCVEVARQNSWDEVEVIDALLKVTTPWREDIREVEQVLRPLGYGAVANHLHRSARYLEPKPPAQRSHLSHLSPPPRRAQT